MPRSVTGSGVRRPRHLDGRAVELVRELRTALTKRMGERGADCRAVEAETGVSYSVVWRLTNLRDNGLTTLSSFIALARWVGYEEIRLESGHPGIDGLDEFGDPMGDEGERRHPKFHETAGHHE